MVADKTGTGPVPADPGQTPRAIQGGWGIGIPKNVDPAQEGRRRGWRSPGSPTRRSNRYAIEKYQIDANRTSAFTDPELVAKFPYLQDALTAIETADTIPTSRIPEFFQLNDIMNVEFNKALIGGQDAKTACAKVQAQWEDDPAQGRPPRLSAAGASRPSGMADAAPAAAPRYRRRAARPARTLVAWLLLGPCVLYLLAFAIYPLFYSLRLSFTDLTAATRHRRLGRARQLPRPAGRPACSGTRPRTAPSWSPSSVALQVVLGMALALFFNLDLKGSWIVRGILVLPMLITPIVVGVMWRALLNPDWGLVNWAIAALGIEPPNWLGSVEMAMKTLILVDVWQWTPFVFIIVFARLQALPQEVFEAAQRRRRRPVHHLPARHAADADAGDRLRRRLPRRRRVPLLRPDLRPELWRAGAQHHDAQLLLLPERLPVPELRLCRRRRLYDADHPHRRHDACSSATCSCGRGSAR